MGDSPCSGCGRDRPACPHLFGTGDLDAAVAVGALPLFDSAVAVTESMIATVAHEGRYCAPTVVGQRFDVPVGQIAVRIDPDRVTGVVTDTATDSGPMPASMVGIVDRRGAAVHRAFVTGIADRAIVGSFGYPELPAEHRELFFGPTVTAPQDLSAPGPSRRIDAILADRDGTRLRQLSETDRGSYQPISTEWIPRIFEHLRDTRTSVGLAVFSGGAMQACQGEVHAAIESGSRFLTGFTDAAVELELAHLETCAIVGSASGGEPTAIEFFDVGGSCSALLTHFGAVGQPDRSHWESITDSVRHA